MLKSKAEMAKALDLITDRGLEEKRDAEREAIQHEDLLDDGFIEEAEKDMESAGAGELQETSTSRTANGPQLQRPFPPTVEDAKAVVAELREFKRFTNNNTEYLGLPDWMYLGALFQMVVSLEDVEFDGKYHKATAVVRRDGNEITRATVIFKDGGYYPAESKGGKQHWGGAGCGIAQTFAAGRAFANIFRWVAILGGYRQTPAEEMETVSEEVKGVSAGDVERPAVSSGRGAVTVATKNRDGDPQDSAEAWDQLGYLMGKLGDSDREWREVTEYQGKGKSKAEALRYWKLCSEKEWNKKFVFIWLRRAKELMERNS